MNTRGQGLVPAKKRATGNKGSKAKPKLSGHELIQMFRSERDFRRAVKAAKYEIKIKTKILMKQARGGFLGKI